MEKVLVLLLFTLLFKEHSCIRGGLPAKPGSVPYQVGLFSGEVYKCGGALISETMVLTSADCVENKTMKAVIGAFDIETPDTLAETRNVECSVIHPGYTSSPTKNNIALLKLDKPVEKTQYIYPIDIAQTSPPNGLEVILSGYGKTLDQPFKLPNVLNQVSLTIMSPVVCKMKLFPFRSLHSSELCTGRTLLSRGRGACEQDEGSPLVQIEGSPAVVGIVSIVPFLCSGSPTVYTNVALYNTWITENLDNCKKSDGDSSAALPGDKSSNQPNKADDDAGNDDAAVASTASPAGDDASDGVQIESRHD